VIFKFIDNLAQNWGLARYSLSGYFFIKDHLPGISGLP